MADAGNNEIAIADRRASLQKYDFRNIHAHARFGTTSDRYAGWIGQIYPESLRGQVSKRRRKLGGDTYEEQTVPIESAQHYFEHFNVLEIDYTYYRPLRDEALVPTTNYITLEKHAAHAPGHAGFYLKAPQQFFARKVRRTVDGRVRHVTNPDFLNLDAYLKQFHEPAHDILENRLRGIIFEQEYQRVRDAPSSEDNVAALDAFFAELPRAVQPHVEIRSPHLLDEPYFDWLETCGIGHVFSHWTWLPPIRKQWKMSGERITAADKSVVMRLLTPLRVPYAKAYALTHPFDKVLPELANSAEARRMVDDTAALVFQAEKYGGIAFILANNRAWGNAPELSRTVAERILAELEKRGYA